MLLEEEKENIRIEVEKEVKILFDRVYNIKKIRRKRKIKEWLTRHLN